MPITRRSSRTPRAATEEKSASNATDRQLPDSPTDSLGFLIADSSRHVRRVLYARIASHGVRGGAWYVLRVLWQRDDLTQRELANQLGLMEPSVQEMLRAMERDGLVTRQRDEEDRRKVRIRLTARARQLKPVLMGVAEEVNTLMLSKLSAAESLLLKLLLSKVRETLAADTGASATELPGEPVFG